MIAREPLDRLDAFDDYVSCFTDATLWQPYVQEVCSRHGQTTPRTIRVGIPGSFPTFIVDDKWVVKFFGRLFNGAESFEAELQASQLLEPMLTIPTAALVAQGRLFPDGPGWHWPYLIFQFVHGVSIGEVRTQVDDTQWHMLARYLGKVTRRLHQLILKNGPAFPPHWDPYLEFLEVQAAGCKQYHQEWKALPPNLIEQIDTFMVPPSELVDQTMTPHIIHADLTADHILGRLDADQWTSLAIIDFGDARVGNLWYELVALHLDLFRGDKRLLATFLDAYALDTQLGATLPLKAMTMTLLFPFDVLRPLLDQYPAARALSSLDELAALLWDVHTPGLTG